MSTSVDPPSDETSAALRGAWPSLLPALMIASEDDEHGDENMMM